jgi:alpha-beta hydrolase superfamily lysophospholipase
VRAVPIPQPGPGASGCAARGRLVAASRRTRLGVGAVLLLAAATWSACGSSNGSGPTSISPDEVLTFERTFVDESRATPPNNGVPGTPTRTLATRIWMAPEPVRAAPACGGSACALILLAHGYGGSTARFDHVGRSLAAAGYVVVAPSFPLTNDQAPGGHVPGLADAVRQPGDLSFLIDELGAITDPMRSRIDFERIGAVGHSLGGSTVLGLTRRPCCSDPRITASALVAPVTALVEAFFGGYPEAEGPPLLVVNGREDPVVPPDVARELYARVSGSRALVVLNDASHSDLVENFGPEELLASTEATLRAHFDRHLGAGGDRPSLDDVLEELGADGNEVASDP